MAIQQLTWNLKSGIGQPETAPAIIEEIERINPDIAFFPEAYSETDAEKVTLRYATAQFASKGYEVVHGLYNDSDGRRDRRGFMAISRLAGQMSLVTIGSDDLVDSETTRRAVKISATDSDTNTRFEAIGLHFDDRSSKTRNFQAEVVLDKLVTPGIPTVVSGDFNSLHGKGIRSKLLRGIGRIARMVKPIEPQDYLDAKGWDKIKKMPARAASIAIRLSEMADGSITRRFEKAGLRDADPRHKATMYLGKFAVAQLDRAMVSPDVEIIGHQVHAKTKLSDHRASSVLYNVPSRHHQ